MPGGQKRRRIDDEITVVDYYFCSEGYRHVRPYVFNFQTHAKARWYGRSILDVFTSEFASHPKAYYATAIEQVVVDEETKHG
jgi:tRNA pseudouridine synthase 9